MRVQSTDYRVPYYQVYHGKSKHCLKGRLVMGYSRLMFMASFVYLNALSLIQLFRISPKLDVFFAEILLIVLTDIFMILTVFSDPGIIPRLDSQFQKVKYYMNKKQKFTNELISVIQTKVSELKFCDSCKIYKTSSTAHCRRCDNCVQGFDHHCLWLGQCIGQRNYRYFYLFLFFLTIMLTWFLTVQIQHLSHLNDYLLIEFIIYALKTFGFLVFSAYLLVLHTYFIFANKTTYEYLTINSCYSIMDKGVYYRGSQLDYIKPIRSKFISFSSNVYYEVPSYVEQQRIQQKMQYMFNDTIDKMQLEEKTKTYQSELCSVKQNRQMQTQRENEITLPQQEFDFRFLKVESESNGEQINQLSHNSSQREEKKDLKIYGLSKSQHIEYNKLKDVQKEVSTAKNKQSIRLNKELNEIQIIQIDKLG
ncbi:unnamed protein product (macronuclear) [Paramecium tetraurelia]|uniref:Palmitoyltransferase n=1 Tax=Paramecium tetraurelia TaxID=5888 RepID=A0DP94_PARTE|nr:uncharacterized protein GSPATT00019043001 [Paramecium tetraurelia]CAK84861.1 unnamed protein product [Paramecium tetraurelia]|eukprot:XP_001452258.1 hypothetical protein (macronuclear) [Paramecium tetraurelia strain d4-2]